MKEKLKQIIGTVIWVIVMIAMFILPTVGIHFMIVELFEWSAWISWFVSFHMGFFIGSLILGKITK